MDAREFEPDDPLPQTCQHCKWGERRLVQNVTELTCQDPVLVRPQSFGFAIIVEPDHTCKHWEERE